MQNNTALSEVYIKTEVLGHDHGPGCDGCNKPMSSIKMLETTGKFTEGEKAWICFFCGEK